MESLDWLAPTAHNLRSSLRDVEAAVLRGWLDSPGPEHQARRAALTAALMRLVDDPATPPRAAIRACRILMQADLGPRYRADRPTRLLAGDGEGDRAQGQAGPTT
jgi:hypothetical protein